jgi:hypothetical protein
MKTILTLVLLGAAAAPAADAPRVSRALLATTEKSLDDRFARLWNDNPLAILGSTRGVYLDGYGVVLTAEVNMVVGGTSLMNPIWSKEDKERHHKKKLERLPQLRAEMKKALAASAATLDPVPADEQVVLSLFLSRYPWEDPAGIPAQVTAQGTKRKLVEAQRSGGTGLDQAVQIKEF